MVFPMNWEVKSNNNVSDINYNKNKSICVDVRKVPMHFLLEMHRDFFFDRT